MAEARSYSVALGGEDSGSEDGCAVPAPAFKRRRRRVVLDSDDESGENDESGLLAPVGAAVDAKDEASQAPAACIAPSISDEEIDAILAIDLDVTDEVGDEECLPSPDDDPTDDEVWDVCDVVITKSIDTTQFSTVFLEILRAVLVALVDFAKKENMMALDKDAKPMTFGYWKLLGRVSVEYLMKIYLPAIPFDVQMLFEKDTWSLQDFLCLPGTDGDMRCGIYGNFAVSAIEPNALYGAYIGSALHLRKRISTHKWIAEKYSVSDLPDKYKRSLHYRRICKEDVQVNFRKLAAFEYPIQSGYLLLLEGVFMILFNTYRHPGWTTKRATTSSYDLVSKIRESLDIPALPWRGMNAAWPLRQGFFHKTAKLPSVCCNPACNRMTYPASAIPEGEARYRRQTGEIGNPLGPYLCSFCYRYRRQHQLLPNANVLAKFEDRARAREKAGDDASCVVCQRLESQLSRSNATTTAGNTFAYFRKFRIHEDMPGQFLCPACFSFYENNRRVRTEAEVSQLLLEFSLLTDRKKGVDIVCQNCSSVEGKGASKHLHQAHGPTGLVLCDTCSSYYRRMNGKIRAPILERRAEAIRQLKEDRKAGKPVFCHHCSGQEGKMPTKRAFAIGGESLAPVCYPCTRKVLH